MTVIKDGYHGDTSRMYFVGEPGIPARRLCEITYESMWRGIKEIKPGKRLGDIGHAIQQFAEKHGYSVVRELLRSQHRHKLPRRTTSASLRRSPYGVNAEAGMVFTVKPMINAGKRDTEQMADGWTIVTEGSSLSAQWERTGIGDR